MGQKKLKVAILGSGNIGADLLVKSMRSDWLECTLFIGRNMASKGMAKAQELDVPVSDRSIQAIMEQPDICDLVFDATSAKDHHVHAPILAEMNKMVVDLTPSRVGEMSVPAVNLPEALKYMNVNMVSCGGQASIPIANVLARAHQCDDIEYIEAVSSIASLSAGPATRINIDEYIETTEAGLSKYSGCPRTKAILILNPADPCIDMQTTISIKVRNPNLERVNELLEPMLQSIQSYVPGYHMIVPPVYENNRVVVMIRVRGLGDYLPPYAGNLDIINCAAIATAEGYAAKFLETAS